MATIEERYDFIGEFYQGIAIVVKDGMYGAILMGGHEIIAPSYDYISSFVDGYAKAIRKGECKILDLSGRECKRYKEKLIAVPTKYDFVREFKDGYACVMQNGKWGVIDTRCNEIFEPQFYYISDFIGGTAKYKEKKTSYANSWGFLNTDGFRSECDMMEPEIDSNGDLIIERDILSVDSRGNTIIKSSNRNSKKVLINNKGQLLVNYGGSKITLPQGLLIARDYNCGFVCVQDSTGYWGAVNTKGEIKIPLEYVWLQDFCENRSFGMNKSGKLCLISSYGSIIKVFSDYGYAEPFKNSYSIVYKGTNARIQGLINLSGEDVLKPISGNIHYTEKKDVFDITTGIFLDERRGLFNASTGLLIMPKYKKIKEVLNDHIKVEIDGFGEGLADFDGRAFIDGTPRVILPDWCLGAQKLTDEIYLGVSDDGKKGLVNSFGETLYPPTFDTIGEIKDDCIITETHQTKTVGSVANKTIEEIKYGLYNIISKASIPAVYDVCPELNETFYKVSVGGWYGALDLKGKEILKVEWYNLSYENGYFLVCKKTDKDYSYKEKYGLFNKKGEQLIEPLYDKIIILKKGLYKIFDRNGWALFSDDGQISKDHFDEMSSIENGFIKVTKDKVHGRIDLNGNKIVFLEDGTSLTLPEKFIMGNDFQNGIAKVWLKGSENYVDKSFNIIINKNGAPIAIETEVDYLVDKDDRDNYIFVNKGLYGLISNEGKVIIKAYYRFLSFLSNDILIAAKSNQDNYKEVYGVIDFNENVILEFEYTSMKPYGGRVPRTLWSWASDSYETEQINCSSKIKYWLVNRLTNGIWNGYGLIDTKGHICIQPKYIDIQKFEHGFFVQEGGKWGVIDSKYRLICEPKYNTLTQLANGLSKVSIVISQTYDRKNELFGILDQFGQEKLEPIYQFIGDVNDNRISKGRAFVNFRGRLGLVDENYNILAEPIYDHISDFKNGKATAQKYIQADVRTLIRGEIDIDGNFTEISELSKTEIANVDINTGVRKIATLKNGYVVVQKVDPSPIYQYCAVTDSQNNIILPFKYHRIEELENGQYKVYLCTGYSGVWGLLDKDFKEIVAPTYRYMGQVQDVFVVSKSGIGLDSNGHTGLINTKGIIILPLNYSHIDLAAPGLVWIYKNGKELVGLATTKGQLLIEPKYGKVEPFNDNLAKVNSGQWYDEEEDYGRTSKHYRAFSEGKWGIINTKGVEVVPAIYDSIEINTENGIFLVTKEINVTGIDGILKSHKGTGQLNQKGVHVIKNSKGKYIQASNKYDWQEDFNGNTSTVYLNGKRGLVNQKMQFVVSITVDGEEEYIILPSEYDWGYDSLCNYIVVEKGNKQGIIDKDGSLIVECIYDKVEILSGNGSILFVCAKMKNTQSTYVLSYEWYLLNKFGERLWPSAFEEIKDIGNSLVLLRNSEGKISISDYDGKLTTDELFDEVKEFGISSSKIGKYSWEYPTKIKGLRYAIVGIDGKYGVINKDGKVIIKPQYTNLSIRDDNNLIADGVLINDHGQRISIKDGVTVIIPEGYEDAEVLQNGLILVKKDQKYGCINKIGAAILPIEYASLKCYGEYLVATLYDDASGENKHGVIDFMNRQIVPFNEEYSEIKVDKGIILFKKEHRWGAFTQKGEIICEPIYDHIIYISDNLIKVGLDSTEYRSYEDFYWRDGERYDYTNYDEYSIINWGVIDAKGNVILPLEYSAIADNAVDGLIEIRQNQRCGYIDITGRILLKPKYRNVGNFVDGYAIVSQESFYYDERGRKSKFSIYGIINSSFEEIIPCVFHSIVYEKEKGLFKTDVGYKTTGGQYLAENNGKTIYINKKYKYCKEFHDDCAIAVIANLDENVLYALVNSKSEDILPPIFQHLELLDNGLYKFKINNKYGLVDSKGNIILPNIYEGIGKFEGNLACVSISQATDNTNDRLYGFIDSSGNEVLPPSYEFIGKRFNNFSVIMKNGTWGLFNSENNMSNMIIEAAFLGPCKENLCPINVGGDFDINSKKVEGGHWGFTSSDGHMVIEPIYEKAFSFSDGLAAVKFNGKWGFIDKNEKIIVPFEYDEFESSLKDGEAKLVKDGTVYVFDKDGKQKDTYNQGGDDYDYYDYDDDSPSYSKYGGYNGWDDNTIDEAFDGNPELTWNID